MATIRVDGPQIARCTTCDAPVPFEFVTWRAQRDEHGRLLAVVPVCGECAR